MTRRIPLFPLNTVLFPGMSLPLRVFEPRYLEMVQRCLEADHQFGVCLIRSGPEVGGYAEPFEVGTTCEILSVAPFGEGRLRLDTIGRERFRLVRVFREAAYLEGEVEPLEEVPGPDAAPVALLVGEAAATYIRALLTAGGEQAPRLQLPEDPLLLSYLVAAVLQVPPAERQALLEGRVTAARLERELELLAAEMEKLAGAEATRGDRASEFRVDPARISLN